jgi:hypothetical protein
MLALLSTLILATGVQHCGTASVGPGSLRRPDPAAVECMLSAFQDGCRPADYTLSSFGVDTVHSETFRIERCTILVTTSFRVVPQQPHVTGVQRCARLRRLGTDVVADRCSGRPTTISLTRLG